MKSKLLLVIGLSFIIQNAFSAQFAVMSATTASYLTSQIFGAYPGQGRKEAQNVISDYQIYQQTGSVSALLENKRMLALEARPELNEEEAMDLVLAVAQSLLDK